MSSPLRLIPDNLMTEAMSPIRADKIRPILRPTPPLLVREWDTPRSDSPESVLCLLLDLCSIKLACSERGLLLRLAELAGLVGAKPAGGVVSPTDSPRLRNDGGDYFSLHPYLSTPPVIGTERHMPPNGRQQLLMVSPCLLLDSRDEEVPLPGDDKPRGRPPRQTPRLQTLLRLLLLLPRAVLSQALLRQQTPAGTPVSTPSHSFTPNPEPFEFVLVDDNPINLRILEKLLRKLFPMLRHRVFADPYKALHHMYKVQQCTDAEGYEQPHVLFLDIEMPGLLGVELVNMLGTKCRALMAVVAVTCRASPDDLLLYEQAGVDHVFRKPLVYDYQKVIDTVVALVDQKCR